MELKFRAWDAKNKKFAFIGFDIMGETALFALLRQYSLEEGIKLEVTQYSGLNDKFGNDVYVGDIIKDVVTDNEFEICFGEYYYDGESLWGWYMKSIKTGSHFTLSKRDEGDIKIIGNIYQTTDDGQRAI